MYEVLNVNPAYQREDYMYNCVYLAQLRARMEINSKYPNVEILNFHNGQKIDLNTREYCQYCAYYGGNTDCNQRETDFPTPLIIA